MKLEINIEKRHFFVLLGAILLLGIVYAFGTNNPSSFGHTPGEIDPGTFGGGAGNNWIFPGRVGVSGATPGVYGGQQSVLDSSGFIAATNFYIKSSGTNAISSCTFQCETRNTYDNPYPSCSPGYTHTGDRDSDGFTNDYYCCRVVCS